MADTALKTLRKAVNTFSRARILVIGDLILDEYIWGDVERISPEAPVPVVWAKKRTFVPGGAANVAANLRSLGAKVSLAGVVGDDSYRQMLVSSLAAGGIDTRPIVAEKGRQTTVKSRIFARHQQLCRVDWEHVDTVSKRTQAALEAFVRRSVGAYDAVIIEDYGKGLFNPAFLAMVIAAARAHSCIITVDPKEDNFESYQGVTSITPNRKEAQNAVRYLKMQDRSNAFPVYDDELSTPEAIRNAGYAIVRHLGLESLLMTLGDQGMWLFEKQGGDHHIPTVAQEVFDVSGAGDTAIAVFTLALASGASKLAAAHLANIAAGIVVGKVGTATTNRKELLERLA